VVCRSSSELATKPPKPAQFESAPLSPRPQSTKQSERKKRDFHALQDIEDVERGISKSSTNLIEDLIPHNQPASLNYGEKPRLEMCYEPLLYHFSSSFPFREKPEQIGGPLVQLSSPSWSKTFQVPGQVRERTGPALIHNQLVDRSLQTNVCDETLL
jgi:hypothetical protein